MFRHEPHEPARLGLRDYSGFHKQFVLVQFDDGLPHRLIANQVRGDFLDFIASFSHVRLEPLAYLGRVLGPELHGVSLPGDRCSRFASLAGASPHPERHHHRV